MRRELLKEIADYLADLDPYKHTRSTADQLTSAPFRRRWLAALPVLPGGTETSTPIRLGPLSNRPINTRRSTISARASAMPMTFRHRLWRATANGQYPATAIPNEQAANQMKVWYDFMATRATGNSSRSSTSRMAAVSRSTASNTSSMWRSPAGHCECRKTGLRRRVVQPDQRRTRQGEGKREKRNRGFHAARYRRTTGCCTFQRKAAKRPC